MHVAHEEIVSVATKCVLSRRSSRILDLGCGNGSLLRKITHINNAVIPFGVDLREHRVRRAQQLLQAFQNNFVVGNIFDAHEIFNFRKFDLAIIMVGRLLENAGRRSDAFVEFLFKSCDHLLVYAYEDTLRNNDLKGFAASANIQLINWKVGTNAALGVGFDKSRRLS